MTAEELARSIAETRAQAASLEHFAQQAAHTHALAEKLEADCVASKERIMLKIGQFDAALTGAHDEVEQTSAALQQLLHRLKDAIDAESGRLAEAWQAGLQAWHGAAGAVHDETEATKAQDQASQTALHDSAAQLNTTADAIAADAAAHAHTWDQQIDAFAHAGSQQAALAFSTLTQALTQAISLHVSNPAQQAGQQLEQHMAAFAKATEARTTQTVGTIQASVKAFVDSETKRCQGMIDKWEKSAQAAKATTDSVAAVGHDTLETIDTVEDGMQAMNVGFKVTVGTFNNVRDIFEEITRI